ncbi:MAG: TlyA family RNA methyltransferase [Acidimicrobiia bacterium]
MAKIKLEKLIVRQNISENLESARELIVNNRVLVNGALINNINANFENSVQISLTKLATKYVSRGGYKLEKALKVFNIDVNGYKALDIGASTGGFSDCLIQNGAEHVIAVDVGRSQLDNKIRNHKQVTIFERLNAKDLTLENTSGPCDICVIDVSFTSILPLLPAIFSVLNDDALIIALIKPQFEGNKNQVNDTGIITDPNIHIEILKKFVEDFPSQYYLNGLSASPITGAKGNIEFISLFLPATRDSKGRYTKIDKAGKINTINIEDVVMQAHNDLRQSERSEETK